MNMVSMKMDESACCEPCPPSAYPYGLRICLNDAQCEALGVQGPISAGTRLAVIAAVTVVRCSEEKEAGSAEPSEIYLDLQITDMALEAPSLDATKLYNNSSMEA